MGINKEKLISINITTFNPKDPQKVEDLKLKLKTKTFELTSIKNSRGWKIISFFQYIRTKIPFLKKL